MSRKFYMAKEMMEALKYIHGRNFLHLDLKPSNILVTKYYNIKIADFGLSQKIQKILPLAVGTPIYMAPEIYKGNEANTAADVYSIGLVFYALFLEEEPFKEISRRTDEEFWQEKIQYSISFPKKCNKDMRKLIESLTSNNPSDRPSIAEILEDRKLEKLLSGEEKFRDIWNLNFADRNHVHIIEFLLKFYQAFNYKPLILNEVKNDTTYKVMKAIMTKDSMLISRDDVNRFINLLNPLDSDGYEIIAKAEDILKKEYFWGALTSEDVIVVFKKAKHNKAFLVRFSATDSGKFTVSWTRNKGKAVENLKVFGKDLKKTVEEIEENGYKSRFITKELPITSYHHMFEQAHVENVGTMIPPEFKYVETIYNEYEQSCTFPKLMDLLNENKNSVF